ncbi:MarR family transcriptional regulator [Paenibacillus sp. CF384]|uniref:MarR family transcriptional regulator n=1 Tax=Paenibacillus sp. CF384 TaxID=1884382 RepID=UPI00089C0DBC|nr:MarR family transcriptional regulator [Paenibacillus sp. CF384]SDX75720.1 DNA-binding transcriptional regulator, MarR family [Paenibacillus sp. CF384]
MDDQEKKLLFHKLQQLFHQYEAFEKKEKRLVLPFAKQWGIAKVTRDLTLSEVHVVEQIGLHEPINVTGIADKMGMTKGAITKISAKLLRRGWIVKGTAGGNLKEVYYQLTAEGKKVHLAHNHYHEKVERQFNDFIQKYSDEQLQFIGVLLADLSHEMDNAMAQMDKMITN